MINSQRPIHEQGLRVRYPRLETKVFEVCFVILQRLHSEMQNIAQAACNLMTAGAISSIRNQDAGLIFSMSARGSTRFCRTSIQGEAPHSPADSRAAAAICNHKIEFHVR